MTPTQASTAITSAAHRPTFGTYVSGRGLADPRATFQSAVVIDRADRVHVLAGPHGREVFYDVQAKRGGSWHRQHLVAFDQLHDEADPAGLAELLSTDGKYVFVIGDSCKGLYVGSARSDALKIGPLTDEFPEMAGACGDEDDAPDVTYSVFGQVALPGEKIELEVYNWKTRIAGLYVVGRRGVMSKMPNSAIDTGCFALVRDSTTGDLFCEGSAEGTVVEKKPGSPWLAPVKIVSSGSGLRNPYIDALAAANGKVWAVINPGPNQFVSPPRTERLIQRGTGGRWSGLTRIPGVTGADNTFSLLFDPVTRTLHLVFDRDSNKAKGGMLKTTRRGGKWSTPAFIRQNKNISATLTSATTSPLGGVVVSYSVDVL